MDGIVALAINRKYTDSQINLRITSGSRDLGSWDAANNNPFLTQGVGTGGDYYHVSVAGIWDGTQFYIGDSILFDVSKHRWVRIATGSEETAQPKVIKYVKNGDSFPETRESGNALVIGDWCGVAFDAVLPFTIGTVYFDSYKDKAVWNGTAWQEDSYYIASTSEVKVSQPTLESISGTATHQSDINKEFKTAIGGVSGKLYYLHTQYEANTTWTITHNLGYYPNVSTYDSAGTQIFGEVKHTNANTVSITFSTAISGKAYLS